MHLDVLLRDSQNSGSSLKRHKNCCSKIEINHTHITHIYFTLYFSSNRVVKREIINLLHARRIKHTHV
jgi:hypothetical protein